LKAGPIFSPPGQGKRKHPVVVQNGKGETLLAWTEGTGWERGGQLAWQVFDSNGRVTTQSGKVDGVPAWSMVAAVAESDGTFTIIY
jgi:hypothetical protein